MIRAVYFHAIEGRMRIYMAGVKGSPSKAREIADRLGCCYGINNVNANPVTGNVLITYDSNRISQWDILGTLREMGYLGEREYIPQDPRAQTAGNSEWSTALARVGLEALLSALIL
jgi:GH43 family beta-xylosidase